jgi:adenylate cyclase
MLRIKTLHDTVRAQAQRLAEQAAELTAWNKTLEERVAAQFGEIERMGRLKQFLAPQIAETIISSGGEAILDIHRRDVVVLFYDMRGFTAFSEMAEPEDVIAVLREYHNALGPLIHEYEGTLDRLTDGSNRHLQRPSTVRGSSSPRRSSRGRYARCRQIARLWSARGYEIGLGVGLAEGMLLSVRSVLRADPTTLPSARSSMLPHGFAPRPKTAKF